MKDLAQTKELNLSMAKGVKLNNNGIDTHCNQCSVLMLANEKLIGKLKKYETMVRYNNSKTRLSLLSSTYG